MNNPVNDIITFGIIVVVLPILTYFIVKFGAAGYYSAKRIWDKSSQNDSKDEQDEIKE